MHRICLIIICLCCAISVTAQPFTLNQGAPRQASYLDTIPYTTIKEKILIPVRVNGKMLTFILDTGAPTILSHSLQQEMQQQVIHKLNVADANTAEDSMAVVRVHEIVLGKVQFENTPALVSPATEKTLACVGASGIIGSNMLRNSVVQFDAQHSRIIISSSAAPLQLPKKFGSDMILDNQSSPIITIAFNKKVREQLLFDSGSDGFYEISQKTFDRLKDNNVFSVTATGVGSNSIGLFGNGTSFARSRLQVPQFTLSGISFTNAVSETIADEVSRLGAQVLRYGVFTIDYPGRKVYLQPYQDVTTLDAYEKQWNVAFTIVGNTMRVGKVWDESLGGCPRRYHYQGGWARCDKCGHVRVLKESTTKRQGNCTNGNTHKHRAAQDDNCHKEVKKESVKPALFQHLLHTYICQLLHVYLQP